RRNEATFRRGADSASAALGRLSAQTGSIGILARPPRSPPRPLSVHATSGRCLDHRSPRAVSAHPSVMRTCWRFATNASAPTVAIQLMMDATDDDLVNDEPLSAEQNAPARRRRRRPPSVLEPPPRRRERIGGTPTRERTE